MSLTITRPDGQKLSQVASPDPHEFSAARDRCDVRVGASWVRGDLHCYDLHAEAAGLAADLVLTGQVPAWRPGAGKIYADDGLSRYFAWLAAVPFGAVEGTLTYDGETHTVRGTGYHDHNWGNVDLPQILSRWYWGRAHVGDFTAIFVEQVATRAYGGQKIPVFLLAQGDRILTGDSRPLTLELGDWQKHPGGRAYPRRADFHWQAAEGTVHLALSRPRVIEATSLLFALPAWQRRLVRLFANPYYFRFHADLELSVDLGGVRAHEHGQALYEIMLLNGRGTA